MRESLKFAVEKFGRKPVVAVELGVAAGDNAARIFKALRCSNLFLVDSWQQRYNAEAKEWLRRTYEKFDGIKNVFIVRQEAIAAAGLFTVNAIDYLYIDDDHSPEHVYKELVAWYKKVKVGGIIAGHDWADNERASKAVKAFCEKYKIEYFVKQNEGEKVADWWFVK